jgi:penicillin-binding protein 1A
MDDSSTNDAPDAASKGNFLTRPFRQTAADLRDPNRTRWQRAGLAGAVAFTLLAILPAAAAFFVILQIPTAPTAAELRQEVAVQPSIVLAADGTEIAQFERRDRMWVPLDSVAQPFIDALISTEDHRFYSHDGIDWRRSVGAGVRTVTGRLEGGSTLSQQLARNLYPDEIGRALSLRRKSKELITARRIERDYSKDQILEAYINTVPFLYNAFGVEMAARTYFGKSADELDVLESATLVGMLKGTAYYNPVRNPERAEQRRNTVLALMVRRGVLEEEERLELREKPLELEFERLEGPRSEHPHFTRYIREWLSEWADRHGYDLYSSGLRIHTTLDPEMQRMAEQAVREQGEVLQRAAESQWSGGGGGTFGAFWARNPEMEERVIRGSGEFRQIVANGASEAAALDSIRSNAALRDSLRGLMSRVEIGFVGIDPGTRHVKVWVGSRDWTRTQFDHVWKSRRQPGSAFKPFVYASALQRGFLPGDTFVDEQLTINVGHGQTWRPRNAGHSYTGAPMTLTEALAYSKNTVTAQLMMEVGPSNVVSLARDMGIRESTLQPLPSLALGTSEVTLLEMVNAFATFASYGRYSDPIPVTRVESADGRLLAEFGNPGQQVLPGDVAQTVIHMLRGAIDRGTGRGIRTQYGITADVAGKTGTSQNGADGWFVMMHPHLVTGAWVGFPEPSITWRGGGYGQGSQNALPVVGSFFRQAASRLPEGRFQTPARYQEPGSIWDRARRWWDDLFDEREGLEELDDEGFYRTDIPYDDLSEWPVDEDTVDWTDELDRDIDDDVRRDDTRRDDVDRPVVDPERDTREALPPAEPTPRDTAPPEEDEPQTAVQRLYERSGQDLNEDLRDALDDDG